jgi:hypothetical protein
MLIPAAISRHSLDLNLESIPMRHIRQAGSLAALIALGVAAGSAAAQTVATGAVGVRTQVTTPVPRVSAPVTGTVRGGAASTAGAGAHLTTTSAVTLRSAVRHGTEALMAGIAVSAEQRSRIEARSSEYATEVEQIATARAEAGARTSDDAREAARDRLREAAADFRARLRALLSAEQQARFDANVRAGATAEVALEPGETEASAGAAADASAEARAGNPPAEPREERRQPPR